MAGLVETLGICQYCRVMLGMGEMESVKFVFAVPGASVVGGEVVEDVAGPGGFEKAAAQETFEYDGVGSGDGERGFFVEAAGEDAELAPGGAVFGREQV